MEDLFGKYELVRRLAFGGMAEIFLARLQGEGGFSKELVVKRILPQFGEDDEFVRMFIDEAVLAAHINHPNVVQIYDFGSHDGVYFIAMEYIDGVDLRQLLKRSQKSGRQLSPAEVAAIGEQAAAGLHFAHCATDAKGTPLQLVHRDISPHNIMLGRGGDVKVMDFGIAKAHARASKTATGTIKGKVAYMAPEHASGERADARSDQFALGSVLWEALAGERLYGGESELELFRDVIGHRVRDLRTFRDDLPEELVGIIERAISKDPEARFDDLAAFATALSHFRFSLGTSGAVQLGDVYHELEKAGSGPAEKVRAGTLVLEDPSTTAPREEAVPTASLPDEGRPSAGISTEPMAPAMPAGPTDVMAPESAGGATSPVPLVRKMVWGFVAILVSILLGSFALPPKGTVEVEEKGVPNVAPAQTRLTVESVPSGASVRIDGLAQVGVTPLVIERDTSAVPVNVLVELEGHAAWEQAIALSKPSIGLVAKLVKLELQQKTKDVSTAPPPVAAASRAKASATKSKVVAKKRKAGRASKPSVQPTKKVAKSTLYLRSSGAWFDVYLGNVKLGTTPLNGVQIPAGRHKLKLRNDGAGLIRDVVIDSEPGGVIRKTVGSQ